jgi:hypothetical protein
MLQKMFRNFEQVTVVVNTPLKNYTPDIGHELLCLQLTLLPRSHLTWEIKSGKQTKKYITL